MSWARFADPNDLHERILSEDLNLRAVPKPPVRPAGEVAWYLRIAWLSLYDQCRCFQEALQDVLRSYLRARPYFTDPDTMRAAGIDFSFTPHNPLQYRLGVEWVKSMVFWRPVGGGKREPYTPEPLADYLRELHALCQTFGLDRLFPMMAVAELLTSKNRRERASVFARYRPDGVDHVHIWLDYCAQGWDIDFGWPRAAWMEAMIDERLPLTFPKAESRSDAYQRIVRKELSQALRAVESARLQNGYIRYQEQRAQARYLAWTFKHVVLGAEYEEIAGEQWEPREIANQVYRLAPELGLRLARRRRLKA